MISYLSDRKQKKKLNKFHQDSFSLTYSVLQSNCFSSVIYISYLFEVTNNFASTISVFADYHQFHLSVNPSLKGISDYPELYMEQ